MKKIFILPTLLIMAFLMIGCSKQEKSSLLYFIQSQYGTVKEESAQFKLTLSKPQSNAILNDHRIRKAENMSPDDIENFWKKGDKHSNAVLIINNGTPILVELFLERMSATDLIFKLQSIDPSQSLSEAEGPVTICIDSLANLKEWIEK